MADIESLSESHQSREELQRDEGSVIAYFLLTFFLTWVLWAIAAKHGQPPISQGVFLLGVFIPGILALALTFRAQGEPGVRRILSRAVNIHVDWRWYLFAIGYVPAVKMFAAAMHRVLTGEWPTFGHESIVLMLAALVVSTWVQAGEEIGWRGYALPRMSRRLRVGPASVILGIIWASWHLPLFFYPGSDLRGQSIGLYLAQVTAISVAMAWLYWRTSGSLFIVMLLHAAANNLKDIVPSAITNKGDDFFAGGSLLGWISVSVLWLCAGLFLFQMRHVTVIGASRPAS